MPNGIVDTDGDGNCGYRSLSLALTGTQSNHAEIRKDITEFMSSELYLHNHDVESHDWWS